VNHADLICVFYKGRIEEMGSHLELIGRGGIYRKMCEVGFRLECWITVKIWGLGCILPLAPFNIEMFQK
jgi:ABC-type multidrug transport system, ATPase and permease components